MTITVSRWLTRRFAENLKRGGALCHCRAMGEVTIKLHLAVEHDPEGWIILSCPELPGCVSQGRTEREADGNIREAILASIETRRAHGLPFMMPLAHVPQDLREIYIEVPA